MRKRSQTDPSRLRAVFSYIRYALHRKRVVRKGVVPLSITDFFSTLTSGQIAGWGLAALVLLLSLIQISPLKLNPWDRILAWLGQKLNGKTFYVLDERFFLILFCLEFV